MQDGITKLEFLAGSPYRVPLLAELAEHELCWEDLKERCGASRTTLQRNLKALEEQGWIQHTNRTYKLTQEGHVIADQTVQLLETIQTADRVQPVLQWLPDDTFDGDLDVLTDATVITRTSGDPYTIQNHYVRRLREVEQVQALLPTTGLRSWQVAHDRILAGDLHCEVVVGQDVAETLHTTPDYQPLLDDLATTRRHEILVVGDSIPYLLALMDDHVLISGYDETDLPRGLIETTHDEAYDWALQTFTEYKQQATSTDPTGRQAAGEEGPVTVDSDA